MNCLHKRIETIEQRFEAPSLKKYIEGLNQFDHWPSFKNFHKTARWIADELNACEDIQARVIEFPADGETMYGDWIMPLAWDAHSASLIDVESGEVLVDYEKVPTAMVMGSAATAVGGVRAELVYVDKPSDLGQADFSGKIVLTGFAPHAIKKQFIDGGGVALLFANKIGEGMDDAVRWVNAWSDDPGLWSMTKADTECPGLSLSINQAKKLRTRLEAGERVTLDIDIQTRSYDGTLPVVEAFIPGQTDEEVFVTGHLYEQGANDNSSGGASMMEIARSFAGTKPKRGIRFLFTSEIYGTIPYCFENKDVLRNVIAGINIDSTAEVGNKSGKMDIIENPLTNPSFVNILMREIIKASDQEESFAYQGFLLDDNLVTDPVINIPCVLVGVCSKNWHTSFDTLDIIDWDLFNLTTRVCATWVDAAANGGEPEASLLKEATESHLESWESSISAKDCDATVAAYREDYLTDTKAAFRRTINQLAPVYDKQPEAVADQAGLERCYFGTPSFSQVSSEKRKELGLNMWAGSSYYPCFFANGSRSPERIAAYMQLSFGTPYERSMRTLTGLTEASYFKVS